MTNGSVKATDLSETRLLNAAFFQALRPNPQKLLDI